MERRHQAPGARPAPNCFVGILRSRAAHAAPARRLALRPSGLADPVARAAQDDGDEDSHRFCAQLRDWLNEAGVNSESQAEYVARRLSPAARRLRSCLAGRVA